ncbi:hypothetical protein EDB81DRAFT_785314 [Dactylonectria macrodidyma]|uniref:Uncharacterized protein n=1 Tax=Dactylonectria macrodidyma TaxID=307937 RepID=A0A9P9FHP8_9HYPO|nr:hypothetical protein EDB81DRAFT_785314 [Dactylonectria macrodidyma]
MCYFNQIRWSCGFWRWRDFRQQCSKEYRTGETCGLKLVYETQIEPDVCKLCHDTEKKQRRYEKMYRDLQRWQREGGRTATIERACGEMHGILGQIYQMREEHSYRSYGGGFGGGMTFQSVSSGVALGGPSVSAMPTMSSLFTMPTFSSSVKVPERLPSPEYGDEVQDHARLRHATPSRSAPTIIPTALRTLPGPPAPPLGSFQDDSVYNGKILTVRPLSLKSLTRTRPKQRTRLQEIGRAPIE